MKVSIETVESHRFSSFNQAVAEMGFEVLQRCVPLDPPQRIGDPPPVKAHYKIEVLELRLFADSSGHFWKYVKR